jgi:hypothetical protein
MVAIPREPNTLVYSPHVQSYVTRTAIRVHNSLEELASVHREATYFQLSSDDISGLDIIVSSYSV